MIELSRDFEVIEIELSSIAEIDTVDWFDDGNNRPTVRAVVDHLRLIEQADPSYPIVLGPDGRVMDGMHRIALAILEGSDTIAAVRFETLPEPDDVNCRPEDLQYE